MKWVEDKEWYGNPSLGYKSYTRKIHGHNAKLSVWGLDLNTHYTVSAGASSELSYTGCFYPEKLTLQEIMDKLDSLGTKYIIK